MKAAQTTARTPALAGFFLCVALLLSACTTPQVTQVRAQWPADVPAHTQLDNTPFFPQEDYECGPASLAMVLRAAGVNVEPAQLVEQVYLPHRRGSLQLEVLAASRRYGVPGYVLQPSLDAVLREVAAGNPVLVFLNLSLPIYPVWHYAVVTGYDRDANTITLHSGRTAHMEMSLFAFDRTWARGAYWSMVALSPTRLPATAQPEAFAAAVAALERSNLTHARTAYATGLAKWPGEKLLLLGSGNAAYAAGDLNAARQAYSRTVQVHPKFADAWNNLAQVLYEQGRLSEAASAAAKAVALGGPRVAEYQALAQLIESSSHSYRTPDKRKKLQNK